MVVYLTSSFIPLQEEGASSKTAPWDCHGFFEDLKKEWPERARLLYVPCGVENNFDDDQMERMLYLSIENSVKSPLKIQSLLA